MPAPTVTTALAQAVALGLERLDAQWLLGHHLQQDRSWLLAHGDAPLPEAVVAAYAAACRQVADGIPLAYLLGEIGFHGLMLQVSPEVLVPRPDTEVLVDWALALLPTLGATPRVLDLGTGSGAIALAVAHRHPGAQIMATDASAGALAVAGENARRLGLAVSFAAGRWWHALPAGALFDLVLSNPPYIAGDDPHLPALRHEPLMALTPGGDGLDAIRAIVGDAAGHLAPGGWLLLEHGWDQADAVATLLRGAGFAHVITRRDLAGRPRCTGAMRPTVNP